MIGHTPGPWIIDGKRIRTQAIIFDGAERGATVAQVDKGAVGYAQTQANATLIAAAPDMLAALKLIAATDEIWQGRLGNIARAAIAKAEGIPANAD